MTPQPSLGEILSASLAAAEQEGALDWTVMDAAADLIAAHYHFDPNEVWGVLVELEIETERDTGLANFGHLLERPVGFASLGLNVAHRLLDEADANALPLICLRYH